MVFLKYINLGMSAKLIRGISMISPAMTSCLKMPKALMKSVFSPPTLQWVYLKHCAKLAKEGVLNLPFTPRSFQRNRWLGLEEMNSNQNPISYDTSPFGFLFPLAKSLTQYTCI